MPEDRLRLQISAMGLPVFQAAYEGVLGEGFISRKMRRVRIFLV
jgi:hypothetical protein